MIIVFVCLLIVAIGASFICCLYLERCSLLRKRLIRLGVLREEVASFPICISVKQLEELLYEKETELAEECFLTVEKKYKQLQ